MKENWYTVSKYADGTHVHCDVQILEIFAHVIKVEHIFIYHLYLEI